MPTQETSEAEIAELDDAIFGEEDVFRFDVAMDAVVRVTVAHCLYQLPRYSFRQYLRHSAIAISTGSTILDTLSYSRPFIYIHSWRLRQPKSPLISSNFLD